MESILLQVIANCILKVPINMGRNFRNYAISTLQQVSFSGIQRLCLPVALMVVKYNRNEEFKYRCVLGLTQMVECSTNIICLHVCACIPKIEVHS